MDISFRANKLKKLCEDAKASTREWGSQNARKLQLRLTELRTAENLAQMRSFPAARFHLLGKGARKRQYAVDLQGKWRLVLEPSGDALTMLPDGGVDLTQVTAVVVVEVVDYHGN